MREGLHFMHNCRRTRICLFCNVTSVLKSCFTQNTRCGEKLTRIFDNFWLEIFLQWYENYYFKLLLRELQRLQFWKPKKKIPKGKLKKFDRLRCQFKTHVHVPWWSELPVYVVCVRVLFVCNERCEITLEGLYLGDWRKDLLRPVMVNLCQSSPN